MVLAVHGTRSRLTVLAFPVTRISVPVHVFAQFSAVFTVTDVLGVDGTRSVGLRSRLTVLAFPVTRISVPVHVFAQFSAVFTVPYVLAVDGTRSVGLRSRLPVLAFASTFSASFQLFLS